MSNTVAQKFAVPQRAQVERRGSLYAIDGGRKYLNKAERARVFAVLERLPFDEALFVETLAWTGARVSEVLELTPSSFSIESEVVAIRTLKRRKFRVREVPIPPSLMKALDDYFRMQESQIDSAASATRLWPWHRTTAWRTVKEVMHLAQIFGRPACPRGLRHGFGVCALQAGVPLNLLQRWLGHARISTTAIYADASGPEERDLARRFWSAANS